MAINIRSNWDRILIVGILAAVVLFAIPHVRWGVVGLVRNESSYRGLPTSYYRAWLEEQSRIPTGGDHKGGRAIWEKSLLRFGKRDNESFFCVASPAAFGVLRDLSTDRNENYRMFAADAFNCMQPKDRNLVAVLVNMLYDEEPGIRRRVLGKLEECEPDDLAIALSRLFELFDNDDDSACRIYAALALSKANQVVLPKLTDMLRESKSNEERERAVWALGRIGPRARPALPMLRQMLTENDDRLVNEVRQAIAQIDPPPVRDE